MKRAYEKICATILVSLCLGPPVSAEPLPVKQPGRMVTSNTDEVGNVCGFLRDFTPLMSREQRYTSGGLRVTGRPPQTELSPSPAWPNLQVSAPNRAPIVTAIGKLAPVFVENIGQVNEDVKFYLRNSGETLWITDKGIVFER